MKEITVTCCWSTDDNVLDCPFYQGRNFSSGSCALEGENYINVDQESQVPKDCPLWNQKFQVALRDKGEK